MREITTEIQISAPIDKVWQVLTDFDRWTEWNPTVKHASGNAAVGSRLELTVDGGGDRDAKYQPVVLQSDPPQSFRWSATMMAGFVFRNDRVFERPGMPWIRQWLLCGRLLHRQVWAVRAIATKRRQEPRRFGSETGFSASLEMRSSTIVIVDLVVTERQA